MRQLTIPVVVLQITFSCLLLTSTAEAAKGIKKGNQSNGTHTVHGIVTSITPDKTGYGVFQIRTSYNHKKSSVNNGLNNAAGSNSTPQHKTFNVSKSTMFQHHSNMGNNTTNPMSLQRGQHVAVLYNGQHADQIQIYNSNTYHSPSRGYHNYYVRHRTSVYQPYAYHHHNHHHRGRF